ncbi:MAG: hypothetical protein M3Y87_06970 [Myxococcota bacterium]|nr:hypothetical protein [Myxococcota bacterium]
MRRFLRLALASSLLLGPASSAAQEPPRPTSGYDGVVPGTGNPPPAAGRLERRRGRRARLEILTWPGFQMMPDGSSRFFVQTTGPVQTDVRVTGERVEVIFPRTGIHLRNSARWLETRFFETPVLRARLERRGRDMVLVMQMRGAATPRVSSGPGEAGDGFQYTYIDFAAGRWAPVEPAPAPAPGGSLGSVSGGSVSGGSVSGGDAPPADEGAQPQPEPRRSEPADSERPPAMGPRPKR